MADSIQLKLKAIWGKNFLGLAIDQVTGTYQLPITTYYFWPRTEAWEQLRLELELKPWIQAEEKVKVLNSAARLMNSCMQEYRNTESIENVKKQFFQGDLVTSQQQPAEEGLQLDNPISEKEDAEKEDAEKEVTTLTYVDHSFEQDLTFIDGLVKTRSRSFLSDPSQLEFEKVLSKYMIILWSLEAYPDLITGIKPEDRSQIQEFVEKKLLDFAKGEDLCFSPNIFMNALRKTSEAGMSELDFAQRDHIIEPFKVKIVKDQEVISRRKKIINGLISEITLETSTKL